jgi:hypothetical protein
MVFTIIPASGHCVYVQGVAHTASFSTYTQSPTWCLPNSMQAGSNTWQASHAESNGQALAATMADQKLNKVLDESSVVGRAIAAQPS